MANKIIKLLKAQEVADILRYQKPDKVYLLVRSGILRGFKRGKIWLIDEDSVYEYLGKLLV